jgi:outer membrane protein OmpA-like peptidoglycan-associated protein
VAKNVGLQLYGGITCLTGDRFDNIPKYCHKSNLIYEAGLKVSYHFGKRVAPHTAPEGASIVEPQPIVEEPQPVVQEKPVVEEKPAPVVEKPQPAVETAAVAEKKPEAVTANLPVIYFAHNSSRLSADEAAKLDAVAEMMKAQPEVTLSIIGHASNIGSKQYNRKLSQRRANSVKRQLVAKGIAASRLKPVVGRGIDRDAADSRQARRVELIINDKK